MEACNKRQVFNVHTAATCEVSRSNPIIPKAQAEEIEEPLTETVTVGTGTALKPGDLFYTTKAIDKCSVSQNEQGHFTKAG
jgi:hypothetical protein